jgi:hypothetical protein
MRKAGLYIVALCTGGVAAQLFGNVVDHFFGPITGFSVLAFVLADGAVLMLTTAYVFSVLAVPKPRRKTPEPT